MLWGSAVRTTTTLRTTPAQTMRMSWLSSKSSTDCYWVVGGGYRTEFGLLDPIPQSLSWGTTLTSSGDSLWNARGTVHLQPSPCRDLDRATNSGAELFRRH
jgi:hypothetical protein